MWLSGLLWDGSNLVKALLHQTTAIVASLVMIPSVNPSLAFSQGSKRIFSFHGQQSGPVFHWQSEGCRSCHDLYSESVSSWYVSPITSPFTFSVPVFCPTANWPISNWLPAF